MRKLHLICIAVILFSVKGIGQPLQKIIFYQGNAANERHWNFNADGFIENIKDGNGTLLNDFIYDANNNLVSTTSYGFQNVVQTFGYDANNHINSYNGTSITFNPLDNSYARNFVNDYGATWSTMGDLQSLKFFVNDEGLLVLEQAILSSNDDGSEMFLNGTTATFENGNMRQFNSNGMMDTSAYAEFVGVANPIKAALLPAMRALAVASYNEHGTKWVDALYNSEMLPSLKYYDSTQPSFEWSDFTYVINANGKPALVHVRNRHFEQIESEFDYMVFYYQGDIIP